MPYVEGESLRDRLNHEKQLPVEDAVRIGRDMAAALDYAHRHGVVHRDIKPENVMLHEGEAIVTDFGIAKAVSAAGGESLTQIGMAVGTPAYMSPEQASGEREPDGRSDIYSLGCVLFEMLTGSAPFTGATVQALIMKRLTDPVPSVRATRSVVTADLEQVVTQVTGQGSNRSVRDRQSCGSRSGLPEGGHAPRHPACHAGRGHQEVDRGTAVRGHERPARPGVLHRRHRRGDPQLLEQGAGAARGRAHVRPSPSRGRTRTSARSVAKLKVATVLEGSVRKAGNRLRVTAQLVDVAGGYHIWSERYDRDLEDVFAVQDEIAENIVRALRVVLSEDERRAIETARPDNVQAYDYYLRGRQFFHQFREKGLQFARRMFTRAIEVDPEYARAFAGVADCSSMLYHYWDASEANLEQADSASRNALKLDPELAEAHASRGLALTLSRRYDEARQEFETAIRLDPKLYEGYYYFALGRFQQGNLAEAAELFAQAAAVRPEDYQAARLVALCYNGLGQRMEAEAAYRAALQIIERHLGAQSGRRAGTLSRRMRVVPFGRARKELGVGGAGRGPGPRGLRGAIQRGVRVRHSRTRQRGRCVSGKSGSERVRTPGVD